VLLFLSQDGRLVRRNTAAPAGERAIWLVRM